MPAQRFIAVIGGKLKQIVGIVTSAGAADEGKVPVLDAAGKFDISLMPVGIGADTKTLVASENLSAGDLVNVWNDSGTPKARKADASSPAKEAHGFVLSAVTATNNATVYMEGTITGLSGFTGGSDIYLSSSTAGAATATPPSTAGHILQRIGTAVSATEVSFEPQMPIELA